MPSDTTKKIKAYYVSLRNDDDAGGGIVFATTAQEARGQYHIYDLDPESRIDVQAHRSKHFDGMEKLTRAELYKECWREGWWFHQTGSPDVEEATDAEFYEWYESVYGSKN